MKRKGLALLLCLVLVLPLFAAAENGITLQDMNGRSVMLEGPAQRIVVLSAADCEILYALGAGDKLVGRGAYCDYPQEVSELPVVNTGADTNLEEIIALDPDVVVMSIMGQTIEQENALENAGIRVITMRSTSIADTFEAIELLGKVTGKNEEAEAMIAEMRDTFEGIAQKAEETGKTIYFEESPLQWGLWAAGDGTFLNELAQMCGLKNIFADITGDQSVSEEQVIVRNPDYILTLTMDFGDGQTPVQEIESRPGWEQVTAVKEKQILNDPESVFSRPGPRLKEAALKLYAFVYGEEYGTPEN